MPKRLAVIWDWNGTLVDDAFLFVDIMNSFLLEHGLDKITVKDYKSVFGFPIKEYYLNLGFDFKNESFKSLGKRFIEKYKSRQFEPFLFDGVLDLLLFFKQKNCKQFVVSAQENSLLKKSIKHYKLDMFFSNTFGVKNVFAKGKVDLALSLSKNFLNDSYEVFVIGDTLHDLEVAQSIGATPVLVSYGHCNRNRLNKNKNIVVDSVKDLFDFFSNHDSLRL